MIFLNILNGDTGVGMQCSSEWESVCEGMVRICLVPGKEMKDVHRQLIASAIFMPR